MKKTFTFFLFFCMQYICAQEVTVFSLSSDIMQELNLTDIVYYTSLEQALEIYPAPINIEVYKFLNERNNNLFDYYYILNNDNYRLSLFKGATSQRYYLEGITIKISASEFIYSLLPYRTIESYKGDKSFGTIFFDDENTLVYEIIRNWQYLTLKFENGIISKLVFGFHIE